MKILIYADLKHRKQVVELWKTIFCYDTFHNSPELVIDKKLKQNDNLFYVGEINAKIVGTIMAGYDGHRGWIYTLAVKPQLQNQGIGSALLEHAQQELKNRGCVKINLQILAENEEVKKFYINHGYTVEKRISMGKRLLT